MSGLQQFRDSMRRDRQWDFMYSVKDLDLGVSQGIILYLEGLNVSFDGFKAINLNAAVNPHRGPFAGRETHGTGATNRLRRRLERGRSV